jgi:hypothetical protein
MSPEDIPTMKGNPPGLPFIVGKKKMDNLITA